MILARQNLGDIIRRIERPVADEYKPMYEAIRNETGGRKVFYILIGEGGRKNFNDGIRKQYIRDNDEDGFGCVVLDQSARFGGDVRHISTPRLYVESTMEKYAPDAREVVIVESKINTGRSVLGAAAYCATGRVGRRLDRIYLAGKIDLVGCSSFCLYPFYPTGINRGPREFLEMNHPFTAKKLHGKIMKIQDGVFFEGELPLEEIRDILVKGSPEGDEPPFEDVRVSFTDDELPSVDSPPIVVEVDKEERLLRRVSKLSRLPGAIMRSIIQGFKESEMPEEEFVDSYNYMVRFLKKEGAYG